jgi:hypothetical protein
MEETNSVLLCAWLRMGLSVSERNKIKLGKFTKYAKIPLDKHTHLLPIVSSHTSPRDVWTVPETHRDVGTAPEAHRTGPTWLYEERLNLYAIFQPQFSTVNRIFISSYEWENGAGCLVRAKRCRVPRSVLFAPHSRVHPNGVRQLDK